MKKLIIIMVLVTSSLSAENSLVDQVKHDIDYGLVNGAFPQWYRPGTKGFKKLLSLSQKDRDVLSQHIAEIYLFFTTGTGGWQKDSAEQNRLNNTLPMAGILLLSNSPQLAEKFQ
ncbi:hypothetical protein M1466_02500 [Candidatus Dependentiae bacterium]|nr:hypothetical protein [Candidatus Dependentiae bacterium]